MGTVVGHPTSPENIVTQCQNCATGLFDHFGSNKRENESMLTIFK